MIPTSNNINNAHYAQRAVPQSRGKGTGGLELGYEQFLKVIFSDKIKWVRLLSVAFLFTSVSLAQLWNQSTHIVNEFKRRANPINLDVQKQCSDLASSLNNNSSSSSIASLWSNLQEDIVKATIPKEHATNANFTNWINTLFQSEYQVYQLRSSAIHPPNARTMLRILQIIHDRVQYLNNNNNKHKKKDDGTTTTTKIPPPLSIAVLGGSVTVGMGCTENHIGLPKKFWNNKNTECAWPARLEYMFNQVLFRGQRQQEEQVVKITNLATGGASTEVGKVVLEYRLFTEELKKTPPHVVIWSHGPNDSQEADRGAIEYVHLPEFVEAARNLHLCDNELPLVVMLDEFLGVGKYTEGSAISNALYKVSSWYGLMGVSHSNVIKHKMYAHYGNSSVLNAMVGADNWNLHIPMGAHIGVAWTVLFNFLKAFSESCDDGPALGYGAAPYDASHMYLPMNTLGKYKKDEAVASLQSRWKEDTKRIRDRCSKQNGVSSSNEVCTYAWMVNPMTGIVSFQNLWLRIKDQITFNDGWKADGNPTKNPRTGWYAKKEQAKFSMKIASTIDTNYLTLMTMKSYSTWWKGAELKVTVRITRSDETQSEESFSISGYHETQTSIHIPHKFQLPGGGAKKGDTIFLDAELVGGSLFKINGMALCAM